MTSATVQANRCSTDISAGGAQETRQGWLMNVVLVMFKDGERRDFPIKHEDTVIGRRQDCDLRIQTGDVSRRHCLISVEEDEAVIQDLESANGTYVNGERVAEKHLTAGDRVKIGPAVFVVQIDGVPAEITPEDATVDLVDLGGDKAATDASSDDDDDFIIGTLDDLDDDGDDDEEFTLSEADLFETNDDDDDPLDAMESLLDDDDDDDERK